MRAWRSLRGLTPAMPLAVKIVLPIVITVISLVIVAHFGYSTLTKQRKTLSQEMATYAAGLERISTLPNHLVNVRAGLYKLSVWGLASLPPEDRVEIKLQVGASVDSAESALAFLEQERFNRVDRVRELFDRYVKAVDQALALIERSPIVGATATRGLDRLYLDLLSESGRLAETATLHFQQRTAAADEAAVNAGERFALLSILFFAVTTLLGLVAATQVSRPIEKLIVCIGELQRGGRKVTVPYCERHDEIGAVARALRSFAQSLEARRELEAELREEKDRALELAAEAEAASLSKSSFLANMSHEIRTPLNGILGMAQFLESEPLSRSQQESVGTILESGKTLMALLNDVLDLSKIEAGKLEIEQTEGDLRNVFLHLQKLFLARAQEKSISLNVEIAESLPENVKFDQIRVAQCVSNLLSNAIKFTNAGRVTVSVDCEPLAPPDYMISVAIADTGIGISEDAAKRLFSEFSQADASTTRKYGGTGLGLAITSRLATLMGGAVSVTSEPGEGSTFTFTFRVAEAAPGTSAAAPAKEKRAGVAAFHGLRVLLVDDNAVNRNVARLLLSPAGIVTEEAANGEEALERLASDPFDLVLLDVHMPIMDGVETIKHIRASEEPWRTIPVIALTADAMRGDRERLLGLGMDGYTSKPIELAVLINEIHRVMEASGAGVRSVRISA